VILPLYRPCSHPEHSATALCSFRLFPVDGIYPGFTQHFSTIRGYPFRGTFTGTAVNLNEYIKTRAKKHRAHEKKRPFSRNAGVSPARQFSPDDTDYLTRCAIMHAQEKSMRSGTKRGPDDAHGALNHPAKRRGSWWGWRRACEM
jgi:hypothetical protein